MTGGVEIPALDAAHAARRGSRHETEPGWYPVRSTPEPVITRRLDLAPCEVRRYYPPSRQYYVWCTECDTTVDQIGSAIRLGPLVAARHNAEHHGQADAHEHEQQHEDEQTEAVHHGEHEG